MRVTAFASAVVVGALALTAAVPPRHAHAIPYEAFIDVESEDDLYDLLAAGQISEETFEILRTLLARGVDLDTASREEIYSLPNVTYDDVDAILAYRKIQGYVGDPANLVAAGSMSEDKLLAISSFLIVRSRDRDPNRPRGKVWMFSRAATGDDRAPPVGVRLRMQVGRHLSAGLAASLTRQRIGAPSWDPNRGGLIADDAEVRPHLPKVYVRYKGDHFDAIAGTYRIGFGERLTFDNSSDYTPDGIYSDDQLSRSDDLGTRCRLSTGELSATPCPSNEYHYITRDYRWSEGLQGVAAGSDHIPIGTGYLAAHVFGSYAARSIYQYELVDRGACPDPREDGEAACDAPPVFVRPEGDPLTATAEHSFEVLPNVYAEALVGGNLTFHARRRDFIGITAYGAVNHWLIDTPDSVQLDTQEWSHVPIGGRYGATGVNVGIGRGLYDLFAEAAYSFDRMPQATGAGNPIDGGGGPAAIVRLTRTERHRELELSARYYDPDFVNPYAGPIAAPDEVEGQRARGEHGVRGKYTGTYGALTVRGQLDLWRALANTTAASAYEYVPRLDVYGRVDAVASEQLVYGVGLRYQDKDLGGAQENAVPMGAPSDKGECYEVQFEDDKAGEPVACTGKKLSTTGRIRFAYDRRTTLTAQVVHSVLDDRHEPDSIRQDVSALAMIAYRPQPGLRLRARVRYRNEDLSDNAYLEHSLATFVEAAIRLRKKDQLQLRADWILWLDDRQSSQLREPSPELWLAASYQASF
jgi:hypothetical protein